VLQYKVQFFPSTEEEVIWVLTKDFSQ
jgi:hypothetical protein